MTKQIFHHLLYNELRVDPEEDEVSILVTEQILQTEHFELKLLEYYLRTLRSEPYCLLHKSF